MAADSTHDPMSADPISELMCSTAPQGPRGPQGTGISCGWLKATILATVATLITAGLVLAVRRFDGALVEPLSRWQMLATAMIATALAAYGRTAWQHAFFPGYSQGGRRQLRWLDLLVGWGSTLGLLLMAVGCCYPAERLSDWLIWSPLLVADLFWRQSFFDGGKPSPSLVGLENVELESVELGNCETASVESEDMAEEQLLQQLFRVRHADGQEMIYGTLRADFAVGQRNATLHVGFCPPLSHRPQIEAEPQEGPECTIKVVQAFTHGAQLDLRLAKPAKPANEPCHVLIDLAALPRELSHAN